MPFSLLPKTIASALSDISPEYLHSNGIRLLMLDFDNTIIPYTTNDATGEMEQWLGTMKESGIRLCVVSNSKRDRVKIFCAKYDIDCVTHAKKPFAKGIQECLSRYSIPQEQCALVGDQIYTDVLGANCAGVRSILVKSIDNHTFWLKARHILEKPFIYLARKRRIQQ